MDCKSPNIGESGNSDDTNQVLRKNNTLSLSRVLLRTMELLSRFTEGRDDFHPPTIETYSLSIGGQPTARSKYCFQEKMAADVVRLQLRWDFFMGFLTGLT